MIDAKQREGRCRRRDYYDFVDLDGDGRVFIIGDISGKGVPAAMMLAYVRAVFRLAVRETREPRGIVARLAEAIHADTGGNPYLTCIVGRVDERSRTLWVTNAGRPVTVVIGNLAEGPLGSVPVDGWEDDRTVLVMAVD